MAHSQVNAIKISALERRSQAFKLRKLHYTYESIGKALGVSKARAHKLVSVEMRKMQEQLSEEVSEVKAMELERLDRLSNIVTKHIEAAESSNQSPNMEHINTALRLMAQRDSLLGLSAQKELSLSGKLEIIPPPAPEVAYFGDGEDTPHASGPEPTIGS